MIPDCRPLPCKDGLVLLHPRLRDDELIGDVEGGHDSFEEPSSVAEVKHGSDTLAGTRGDTLDGSFADRVGPKNVYDGAEIVATFRAFESRHGDR